MRRSLPWLVPLWLSVQPLPARATDLVSDGGFTFDVREGSGGQMNNGTTDAYDGAYYLDVNGTTYTAGGAAATTTLSGRNLVMADMTIGSLTVHREAYVPASGGDYVRYVDVIENGGGAAATVTLAVHGDLGSDSATSLYATGSGDASLTPSDTWFGTDDADGVGDPALAHVVQGASPRVGASSITLVGQDFRWEFTTIIPAGGRAVLISFGVQQSTRAAAQAEASRLADLPDDAAIGLDAYLGDVLNFAVAAPGAPEIRFDGPIDAEEGAEIAITVEISDAEGDDVEHSWDLDANGTFGENPGATTYRVPADTTDGPGIVRVGVRATDGTNTSERYRAISIRNAAPEIVSDPPNTQTSVAARYRYAVEVDDPGGEHDPLVFSLLEGPDGMVLSEDGILTWVPGEEDVTAPGVTIAVSLRVVDDDEESDTQLWEMTVLPNHAPTDPTPIYPSTGIGLLDRDPRLVVTNATDADFDPLSYFFEIDVVDTFDSEELRTSGEVAQSDAFSFWRVEPPLAWGTRYFWRAWAFDGAAESAPVGTHFFVVHDPDAPPDAGPSDADAGPDAGRPGSRPPEEKGCAVSPGRHRATGAGLVAGLLAGLALTGRRAWRRRRARGPRYPEPAP